MSYKASMACAGAFAAVAIFAGIGPASAHTIIGNRVFPATLTIDDPGVDDEFTIPTFNYMYLSSPTYPPVDGAQTYSFDLFWGKRITSDFELSIDSAFLHQVNPRLNGWTGIETEAKYQIAVSTEHEFVVSVGVAELWGGTATREITLATPSLQHTTITPKAFIGKGFGDLETDWLRPFAITGEIDYVVPTVPAVYQNGALVSQFPTSVVYGATIQYSLLYMNGYVKEVPEILRNLIITGEAIFTTPVSNIGPSSFGVVPGTHETTGFVGPGLYYLAHDYELGIYGALPINQGTGKHPGVFAIMDFFFDDLFPNTLGKPIFGPAESRAFDPWHAFEQ
jgi:hypothetical protein